MTLAVHTVMRRHPGSRAPNERPLGRGLTLRRLAVTLPPLIRRRRGTVVELTRGNFREIVGTDRMVLVECWRPGCAVCEQFDPIFFAARERHPAHVFARMNVATDERLGAEFDIAHTPTLMLYRDGLLLFKQPGIFEGDQLDDIVRQAERLDMDLVRADMETEHQAPGDGQPAS